MLNSVAETFWMPFASAGSRPGAPPFADEAADAVATGAGADENGDRAQRAAHESGLYVCVRLHGAVLLLNHLML